MFPAEIVFFSPNKIPFSLETMNDKQAILFSLILYR